MATSQEVVFEGWLTKSPPTKRIWRARWRRRWFLLTHSSDIPGQYILTYYTDRNCRKLKGEINLDRCEQVDLGLKFVEKNLKLDYIFLIKTPNRTYYLAADTEEEMKSWVTCICRVCCLKSKEDEKDSDMPMNNLDIEITEENPDRKATPPISPVSTSPYIPISECITGRSPVFDAEDIKLQFAQFTQRHRYISHNNDTYESHNLPQNSYINLSIAKETERNYINLPNEDPRFYDSPRALAPQKNNHLQDQASSSQSPLLTPTDTDSVFNDEEWVQQQHLARDPETRPSDSSVDLDTSGVQKFTKPADGTAKQPPPRPPKPANITWPGPCYLNLAPTPSKIRSEIDDKLPTTTSLGKVVSDDMYDFPRSHNYEPDQTKNTLQRRHCYNNAAPTKCPDGIIFKYEISPKPTASSVTSVFKYDGEATQDLEPSSPAHSHTSSTPAYSNLPSPLLAEAQLMPPPTVNRELKPRRKLSDTRSTCSATEPPSPRISAPSVDRKLKPPTPLQEAHMRKSFHLNDDDSLRKIRAAPSPTPPGLMLDDVLDQNQDAYHYISNKMQYLDLDLEGAASAAGAKKSVAKPNESDTVYKKVDFIKTEAFNITRNNLEKERQEPVTTFVKK